MPTPVATSRRTATSPSSSRSSLRARGVLERHLDAAGEPAYCASEAFKEKVLELIEHQAEVGGQAELN
jgi:hypothetical protein